MKGDMPKTVGMRANIFWLLGHLEDWVRRKVEEDGLAHPA